MSNATKFRCITSGLLLSFIIVGVISTGVAIIKSCAASNFQSSTMVRPVVKEKPIK